MENSPCYAPSVPPNLDTGSAGAGSKPAAMWLDDTPCLVVGIEHWPTIGDRLVIDGELWRLVEVSDRWVL